MPEAAQVPDFGGIEVAAFESRKAKEMAALIANYGGRPRVTPSMREIPLEENPEAFEFARELFSRRVDAIICMTGVGTRILLQALETRYPRQEIVGALAPMVVVARGPKTLKALREFRVPITINVPPPNTWREVLQELDNTSGAIDLKGRRMAVQEYGITNQLLIEGLKERGAEVLRVPVYRWALPENLEPLRSALREILAGRLRVILFTNAGQVQHLMQVAQQDGARDALVRALRECAVCSIGPTCSEALAAAGIQVDLEPEQSKMGLLVYDAAKNAPPLLNTRRAAP